MTRFLGELIGTAILILLGNGVVANVSLNETKGRGAGWIVIMDGAYAAKTLLRPLLAQGVHVISRLRRDAQLYDLPDPPSGGRGRPRIYGSHRIHLAKRAGHPALARWGRLPPQTDRPACGRGVSESGNQSHLAACYPAHHRHASAPSRRRHGNDCVMARS